MPDPRPITKSQQQLIGKDVHDMTAEQIRDWICACDVMEGWVGAAKARRSWTDSRRGAEAELDRRVTKGSINEGS